MRIRDSFRISYSLFTQNYVYYIKSIDLMHFGWNIGKAFGKKRIHTATFIKRVFAHALRDLEVSTIERKMSHTESECKIKLNREFI